MPVIINEMEVAVVPPVAELGTNAILPVAPQPAVRAELGPHELTLILRREAQRRLRLEAH